MKIKLFFLLPLLVVSCGQTETKDSKVATVEPEPKIITESVAMPDSGLSGSVAITVDSLTKHIKILSSDEFGGRGPGTEGEELTVNYLVEVFTSLGLEPANGNSYIQSVPLMSVEAQGNPHLFIRGGQGNDMDLIYSEHQVIWTRKQINSVSISDSELVFVGYGINAPERNWNDYATVDVKGKTVVILINDPGYATQNPDLFNGNAMTYYGRWDYKFAEAARQGASSAIIIHDTLPAAYPWQTVSTSWTGPQFDIVRENKGDDLVNIEGWITLGNAAILFSKAGLELEAMYQAANTQGFKAIDLKLTATASIENKLTTLESKNVAAIVRGTESPEEVFIYMAHWDHLGTDLKIEGDGIYNGALDNASGTAGLLELAKAYISLTDKPKRSVMFLALTAEEQGLLGSVYYAANPLIPLANTVGGLNMDGLNIIGPTTDVILIGQGMSQLEDYLLKHVKRNERFIKADALPEKGFFYRSDHFELAKLGVPMLYPKWGNQHKEKGEKYAVDWYADYVANDYHQPSDEYNASWVLTGAVEDLKLYFHTGLDIANSSDWPEWNEGTEFKAIRDKQRDGQ